MIGHGMMGNWHSQALAKHDCVLDTLVGRREEPTKAFAEAHGYRRWTLSLDDALADPEIDIVIIASPSEQHPDHAIRSLKAGKHTLIEIPIAMNLKDAERVVAVGEASGKSYGLCHPMRFRRERDPLKARLLAGEENLRHLAGRFFIKRLTNVGATGYERSWTDN
ncbi:MAG: Gfo/Idh/MocA family oxidoreductase, partial [Pseudomonadota bacterium]